MKQFTLTTTLLQRKIYVVPVVGYTVGINPPIDSYGAASGTQTSNTTTIDYSYTESADVSCHFSLLQTGVGIECNRWQNLLCSISVNYYSGFNETTHLDITYTVNNSSPTTGTAITKGQFWSVSTGLKYPVSNLWTKKNGI